MSPNNAFVNIRLVRLSLFHLSTHTQHTNTQQIRKVRHEIQIGATRNGSNIDKVVLAVEVPQYFRRHSLCVLVECNLVSEMVRIRFNSWSLLCTPSERRVLGRRVCSYMGYKGWDGKHRIAIRLILDFIGPLSERILCGFYTWTLHVQCDVESQAIDYRQRHRMNDKVGKNCV